MRKLTKLITAALLLTVWACEGPDTPEPTPTPTNVEVTSVSLDKTLVELTVGGTVTLSATVMPGNASSKNVTWSSSDSNVASVSDGTVKGVAVGTATITATAGSKTASCAVTVVKGGFVAGALPPSNEIWYTTSDNQPLVYAGNQGSCVLVAHTYNKGVGVLRFHEPVTSIDAPLSGRYEECERLTGILVPEGLERIGKDIFLYVPNLTEFRVPASLKSTGSFASLKKSSLERFTGHHVSEDGRCIIIDGRLYAFAPAGLTSYEIPSGVTSIGESAFALNQECRSVVIPEGVTALEFESFARAELESVTIPASVKAIDSYAFLQCSKLKNLLGDSHFISKDRKFLYDENSFYPMSMFLFAGKDDVSYEIPEGIFAIENYTFYGCDKLKDLTFPNSLGIIAGAAFENCNPESLHGYHVTSDGKGFVSSGRLQFLLSSISDDYVIPAEVTALGDNIFDKRPTLRSVTMGDQVTSIGHYAFSYCPSLKTVTLSARLASIGYNPFLRSSELESVYFRGILPPTVSAIERTDNPKLTIYVPEQAVKLYTEDLQWEKYWGVMKPYGYKDLPEPDFYLSSDYSKEGKVTVYQRASEGNGVDIVFMGDAYSDRQVADGTYMHDMEACAEQFFSVEPYKTFRNLFNIYFVSTVSATEGYDHGGRSLGTYFGNGTYIGGNDAKCLELARKAVRDEKRMEEVLIVVCGNQDLSQGFIRMAGTCHFYEPETWTGHDYACGPALTYFTKVDAALERTGETLRHEAGGHGFAKLADEYNYSGTVSSSDRELIRTRSAYMWYSNVDVTSDRSQVKWANFLADDRYKDEVGMYEGGFTYEYGVWRPSETSIMLNNRGTFNAPSRYTIWYRIHKLAYGSKWNGTFEDFAAYDAINRKSAPAASGPLRSARAGAPRQHQPPVMTGLTWREAVSSGW